MKLRKKVIRIGKSKGVIINSDVIVEKCKRIDVGDEVEFDITQVIKKEDIPSKN